MEQSLDKKPDLKESIKTFFINNKKKIFLILILALAAIIIIFLWKENQNKKNVLIAEKYVKAGLLLSKNETVDAVNYYEEIIISNNKFYSILALNTILEKELIKDEKKILEYFKILEQKNFKEENLDLIIFKKALFLIKISDKQNGNLLLKKLIEKNSSLKGLAQEIVIK